MRTRSRHLPVFFSLGLALAFAFVPLGSGTAAAQAITGGAEIAGLCRSVPAGGLAMAMDVGAPGASAGQTVIIAGAVSAGLQVSSVTDGAVPPNTYTIDVNSGATVLNFVVSSRVASPLPAMPAGITVTLTNSSGSPQSACVNVAVFSNLLTTAGWLDGFGAASGSSTAPAATSTGPTTQPNDLVLGVFGVPNGITAQLGPGFTGIVPQACIASPVSLCVHAEFKIVSAVGIQTATLNPSSTWTALVAAYKGSTFPVELQMLRIE